MTHICHARGCEEDAHPEMPFCKRHANLLPEPHKLKLWNGRPRGKCGCCEFMENDGRDASWNMLLDLGIAMLLLIEFGNDALPPRCGCGAPPGLRDDEGFCWGCGVYSAEKTYEVARKAIRKYKVQIQAQPF